MSFILDALRKSEAEKARGEAPSLLVSGSPRVRPLAELPSDIVKADSSGHHYRVQLTDGSTAIIDAAGRLLWQGAGGRISVHTRRYALIDDGEAASPRYRIVHLDLDASRRREVAAQIPAGTWWIGLDPRGYGVARRGVEAWHRFSLADGALEKSVLAHPVDGLPLPAPGANGEENRQGRFYRHGRNPARLYAKADGHEARLALGPQHYQDALPTGRGTTLLLLADAGRLWLQAAPEKPAELLGQVEGGDHFRTADKGRTLGVVDAAARLVHAVIAGPKLGDPLPGKDRGEPPDDLGWRFDHGTARFTVPGRGREQAWKVIDATRILSLTANLGDAKTTIVHPATTTHGRLSAADKARSGITENLIRVAVGLEDRADIQGDLSRGLDAL